MGKELFLSSANALNNVQYLIFNKLAKQVIHSSEPPGSAVGDRRIWVRNVTKSR